MCNNYVLRGAPNAGPRKRDQRPTGGNRSPSLTDLMGGAFTIG